MCTHRVEVENRDLIVADRIGDLSMFESQALMDLFERAERAIDASFAPGTEGAAPAME